MRFVHKAVLFSETIEMLKIKPDGIYVDGTAGGGGHSEAILKKLKTGTLVSIDQDPDAIAAVKERFVSYSNSIVVRSNFSKMDQVIRSFSISNVDGVLLDIGVSSHQLDKAERGFSFHKDAPLDMRMSQEGVSAYDLVNTMTMQGLAEIFSKYGEEKFARNIAKAIVKAREHSAITSTEELAELIKSAVPAAVRREGGHPARKTFQALRIAVNDELGNLSKGLDAAFSILKPGGRLVVITFHSLEDRIVKQRMAEWCMGCTCPKDFPICVCGKTPRAKLIQKKPIEASTLEKESNPRSRSAKLRGCIRLE